MSSESGRGLSTEELKRLNQSSKAAPPPMVLLREADWKELLDRLEASAAAQETLLRALSQLEQGCQSAMQHRLDAASGRLMMAEQQLSYDMTRRKLTGGQAELAAVQKELEAAAQSCIQKRQAQLRHAAALTDSLSPYRVLGRGYAMVYDSKGRLCSADVLATGDKLTLRGAVHTAECTVTSVEELNESTQKL